MSTGNDGGVEENMAAWLLGVENLQIQPYILRPLGPLDVKVLMKAVGICGSDIHHFKNMRVANFIVKKPMVLGHECAGIVEEVGCEVKSLSVGDRVALEPGISCQSCNLCKQGRYNLCPKMKFFGSPPTNGSLANQVKLIRISVECLEPKVSPVLTCAVQWYALVVHPANLCFKLPDNVSLEEGAMIEPLSVGVHACRRANVTPCTNVLILGSGPIGLVTMMAARAYGAPKIIVVDVDDQRLSFAKDLGADETIQVSTNNQDIGEEVTGIQKAMGAYVDISFDCVGFSKTISTALNATRSGGKVCLVGLGQREMTVPLVSAAAREVDIVGIFRYRNTWPLCIELIRSGKIDVKRLITHRYMFNQEDVERAFATSAQGGSAIKVMFNL